MSIYDKKLPNIKFDGVNDKQEAPFDCDNCHRIFTLMEIHNFCMPFANRGEQKGVIRCPKCGYEIKVDFAVDSVQ